MTMEIVKRPFERLEVVKLTDESGRVEGVSSTVAESTRATCTAPDALLDTGLLFCA